jgi:nucleotide-binding universal stress UspA family protein
MTDTILVGFDGSPDATAAVRWAAREAAVRGASLHLLHTYDYPYLERLDPSAQHALAAEADAVAGAGRDVATAEVPDLEVTTTVRVGQPAAELIEAAADSTLLVLGRRGGLPLHRLLLGSVANKCLHHAPCPVVVISHDEPEHG